MIRDNSFCSWRPSGQTGAKLAPASMKAQIELVCPPPGNDNVDDLAPFINLILAAGERRASVRDGDQFTR